MKYHPDRNPGDHDAEERFKEAKEAYEVLSESQKRAVYDQYGHAGLEASRSSGGGASGFTGAEAFSDIFGDVFGDIFGGARRGGGPQVYRGADLRYEAELDLDEAVFGRSIEIDAKKFTECELCRGTGAAKGSNPSTCETCRAAARCAFPGLLHLAADLSPLPWLGPRGAQSLRSMPGSGARDARQETVGEDSSRGRYGRSRTARR